MLDDHAQLVSLNALGELYCGQSPTSTALNSDGRGWPYITGPEAWNGHSLHATKWVEDPPRTVPDGCIFITVKGAGVGKLFKGIACAIGRDVYAFKPHPEVDEHYVLWALRSVIESVKVKASGDIPGLSKDDILGHDIPFFALEGQRRIVAKLDAIQSRTRLAREALASIPALLDHYRQSVLAAAFRGVLTAQWRSSSARRTVVKSAVAAIETPPRPSRYNSRTQTIIPGDYALSVGDPQTDLPAGWQWVPLVDIARLESGHTPSRKHPEWWGGKVPWICIPDARDHHGKVIMTTTENTNPLGIANSAARILPAGTVCLSRTASVGYVTVMGKPMATSQDFVNWTCTSAIDPHWLKFLLIAENQALFRFGEGSTHTTIYFPEVLSFHVGLPPIEEQQEIVARLEQQLARIEELRRTVEITTNHCISLEQSTLATAFRGELVPQDPSDEPASVLLDRIRAARAEAEQVPRKRRSRAPTATQAATRAAEPAVAYRAGDPYAMVRTALRKRGNLTNSDAQEATGLDAAGVRPLLQRLVAEGHARIEGQKRGTRYVSASET